MKKIKLTILILMAAFLFIPVSNAQAQDDMDFEEFMGMLSETFTGTQLDELSFQLPWDIRVYGYGYGDFSGDGGIDFVIAVKESNVTPPRTLDVYFLENIGTTTYKVIEKKNYRWVEIPIEVAFLCRYGKVFVASRDNSNWYFESFRIQQEKLVQLEKDVYPIESGKAGE